MKKRLLLVLTIVMLMVVAAFSANAACEPGQHKLATKTVAPTCEDRGYDIVYCVICKEEISKDNFVTALGHEFVGEYVLSEDGTYYKNLQTCTRTGCDVKGEVEGGASTPVKYFSVQFVNAKATGSYLKTYNGVGVAHAKLTGAWYNKQLNSATYVKEGGSYTYDGDKPVRNKDVAYGKYNFVGWTDKVVGDIVQDTNVTPDKDKQMLNLTVKDIRKNTVYYACWQGEVVSYRIQFVNADGSSWISANNGEVMVAHGYPIDYKWIYPSQNSTTSNDFKFAGWVCGDPSKTDAAGNYTEFDEYLLKDGIHIKNVPIFSADAMKAKYDAISREYVVEFDLKNGNAPFRKNVAFGKLLKVTKDNLGDDYTLELDSVNYKIPAKYTDSTYTYLFEGGFETTTGHKINNHSFSVPQNTLDNNDSIFLVYASDMSTKVQADGKDMVLVDEIEDPLRDFRNPNEKYDYTKKNLYDSLIEEYYNFQKSQKKTIPYTKKHFNLNTTTYLFLKSEHGNLLVDEKGNYITLEVSLKGIYRSYISGDREKIFSNKDIDEIFNKVVAILNDINIEGTGLQEARDYFGIKEDPSTKIDIADLWNIENDEMLQTILEIASKIRVESFDEFADALRLTKVEPSYRSIITMNEVVFEIIMPVRINGKEVEDSPAHFNDLLTVQVKNQNGKLIGRSTTGNSNKKEHEAFNFTDDRGNEYRKFFCVMSLEKADRYEIVVASNDGRNKYEGTRTLFWSTYESTHKNGTPVTIDLSVSADYNQGLNCYCLCHGPLKGLWARILNILYSLFKMQHECCPHMHAEIGDILAY